MSQEIVIFDVNDKMSLEHSSDIKEEFQDEYCPDNKVFISETTITDTINISNTEINAYIKKDKTGKYEMLSVDNVKTDLPSEVNNTISNNFKIEDGICPADIQIEFDNELLVCNHCHEVYQDYCTKCKVLMHIFNGRSCDNTYNRVRELPKYMLEARESLGHLGIFSLKVIPEDVRFGPFTGLNSTGLPLRIKEGRFVASDDKSEHLNWMQYINPARNNYEQNLFPFQYDDKLYYCSTRRIQKGEELLVYFGEEYEDNLLKNMEMDFVPIAKMDIENVFACTFCCLGFSSEEYLAEHKTVTHSETKEIFSVEGLMQCPFCKIYLETKEYFQHHADYCCKTNDRYCVLSSPEVHGLEVERRLSKKHICPRRYKTKESLKAHTEKNHANNAGRGIQKSTTCEYFKANTKNINERSPHSHDDKNQCQSTTRKFQTREKCHLKPLIKKKHLKICKYKCANCEFKTYGEGYLKRHMKIKHLIETNYKCSECEFETNYKICLVEHKNAKHLKANNYKCMECEFKTYYKSNLDKHIQAKHVKQKNYKCAECEYMTNYKSSLEKHIKSKHLKQNDYNCAECEFKTNYKIHLEKHVKARHLKQKDYKCTDCEYMANRKATLQKHIQARHLKQKDYKCTECEYMAYRKSCLQLHIKAKHLKQNDFKCTECEYIADRKSTLQNHIRAKHLKQEECKCAV